MNKKLIIIFIIITAMIILALIFLFPKNSLPIVQKTSNFPAIESDNDISLSKKPSYTTLAFPQKQQKEVIQNYIEYDSLADVPAREDLISKIENFQETNYTTENINPSTATQKLSEAEIEQQIFIRLYPDYFTNGLAFTQKVFIEQNFLDANYQEIKKFDTEEKIFAFANTIIDVFEEQGFYTKEEAEKFRTGANETWKNLLESEKIIFRSELISSELSKRMFANILYRTHEKASKKIISIVKKIENITSQNVYAADCFRSGGAGGIGANVSAPCCNCGLKCSSHGCAPVQDCGESGSNCDIQLGCKNLYGAGRPVIWDSSSGICGVG